MKAWLTRAFERIIGGPGEPVGPAPSVFGAEAHLIQEDEERSRELQLEIERNLSQRRGTAG